MQVWPIHFVCGGKTRLDAIFEPFLSMAWNAGGACGLPRASFSALVFLMSLNIVLEEKGLMVPCGVR